MLRVALSLVFVALPAFAFAQSEADPPPLMREFRGAWVATVANIDWPSKPGLPVERQKAELIAVLDRCAALNLNAVVFQVRPAADALYASKLEPWSAFLTGEQGKAPEPFYDPLALAVEESHKRGLELHAWFNPYRALHPSAKGDLAETHLSNTHPELVKKYGKYLWMDPGEKGVQDHSLAVVTDIVKRYDVDGVHLDDYFYPYKEKDEAGNIIDFPDEASYAKYRDAGGKLEKDDWRRQNVDTFIKRLYEEVKAEKPWVKVGLSPFGIWRPGNPEQIQGFDAYAELYADSRKWLQEGWCDYFTPQLYWPVGQTAQDYIVLQDWWVDQNAKDRHIWPGLFTSRVGDAGRNWEASVITKQIQATRGQPGASGNVHFSMKALMTNRPGLDAVLEDLYAQPALVPASPWLDQTAPAKPNVTFDRASRTLKWVASVDDDLWSWAVQFKVGDDWTTRILPAATTTLELPIGATAASVKAIDRVGNESEGAIVEMNR